MRCNPAGIALIQFCEGCRLAAYQDDAEFWTIGWGHRGPEVTGGLKITQAEADTLFEMDLSTAERVVEVLTAGIDLNENQYSALVSFTYNLGFSRLQNSLLLSLIQAGKMEEAADQFPRWCHVAGEVSQALLKRRTAEMDLFLSLP